jgi:hypothetical protein
MLRQDLVRDKNVVVAVAQGERKTGYFSPWPIDLAHNRIEDKGNGLSFPRITTFSFLSFRTRLFAAINRSNEVRESLTSILVTLITSNKGVGVFYAVATLASMVAVTTGCCFPV